MKRERSHRPVRPAIRAVKCMIAALLLSVFADAIWQYCNFLACPNQNVLTSAPWYTGVLVYAVFTAVGVGLLLVLLCVLYNWEKKTIG